MSAISEFESIVDSIYGVYLDATSGFSRVLTWVEQSQKEGLAILRKTHPEKASMQHLDSALMVYGKGDPNDPDAIELHRTTQGEFKARNSETGSNYRFLGNMAVVAVYQYWEDFYRGSIAAEIGIEKLELQAQIMGDLRLLRISIIHHAGIALKNVENCELLKWYCEGDDIFIDKPKFEEVVLNVKRLLKDLSHREKSA